MALATAELYSFTKALSFFNCSKNCYIAASLMDHPRQTGMRLKGVPATGKDVSVFHAVKEAASHLARRIQRHYDLTSLISNL